jgi:hypothetical protein
MTHPNLFFLNFSRLKMEGRLTFGLIRTKNKVQFRMRYDLFIFNIYIQAVVPAFNRGGPGMPRGIKVGQSGIGVGFLQSASVSATNSHSIKCSTFINHPWDIGYVANLKVISEDILNT